MLRDNPDSFKPRYPWLSKILNYPDRKFGGGAGIILIFYLLGPIALIALNETLEKSLLYILLCLVFLGLIKPITWASKKLNVEISGFLLILILLLLILVFGVLSNKFEGYRIFGLNQSNTLYDYKTASTDDKVDWQMRLREFPRSLGLVNSNEYKCGYRLQEESFSQCISGALKDSEPWEKLGSISRKCAMSNIQKTETPDRPEDCKPRGMFR